MDIKKQKHEKKRRPTREETEFDRRLESERLLAKKLRKEEVSARKEAIKNRKPFKGLSIKPTVSLFDEEGREEVGERNWKGYGLYLLSLGNSPVGDLLDRRTGLSLFLL